MRLLLRRIGRGAGRLLLTEPDRSNDRPRSRRLSRPAPGRFPLVPPALVLRAVRRPALFARLACRGAGGEARRGPARRGAAARRQRPAAAPEVARDFRRPAGLAPRRRSGARNRQRHLRAGAVRQVRPRLPGADDGALVSRAVSGAARLAPAAVPGARDDPGRISPGDLGRRRADRAGGGRDPDRRSAEARRRHEPAPPRRGQRMVRFDAVLAAEPQSQGIDRHRHAAPARGRPRRPCDEAGRLGGRLVPGDRRRGRTARNPHAGRIDRHSPRGRRRLATASANRSRR